MLTTNNNLKRQIQLQVQELLPTIAKSKRIWKLTVSFQKLFASKAWPNRIWQQSLTWSDRGYAQPWWVPRSWAAHSFCHRRWMWWVWGAVPDPTEEECGRVLSPLPFWGQFYLPKHWKTLNSKPQQAPRVSDKGCGPWAVPVQQARKQNLRGCPLRNLPKVTSGASECSVETKIQPG